MSSRILISAPLIIEADLLQVLTHRYATRSAERNGLTVAPSNGKRREALDESFEVKMAPILFASEEEQREHIVEHVDFLPTSPRSTKKGKLIQGILFVSVLSDSVWKSAAASKQRGILKHNEPTSVLPSVHDVIPRRRREEKIKINKKKPKKERFSKCLQAKCVDYRKRICVPRVNI
ncbi:hypothetical protein CEXT_529521 [Caerostris extrusa]|uniref:Uncharacterized protein n=1 Tax=Caerostris extrusa TaxID=172846 RepID=A0AAV4SBA3_CAEEX|nr:hypothetical protein CEXT_529521 [Caerostris extrusa]